MTISALRRYRSLAAALFIVLAMMVITERRLAEAYLNSPSGLESEDSLTGDEVTLRLLAFHVVVVPTAQPSTARPLEGLPPTRSSPVPRPTRDGFSPRAPPSSAAD